jgi:RNase P/RNase MRP subunit p29
MKTIIDSTDKKHIGEVIDETANPVVFSDGETMQIAVRLNDNTVLANSNYIITLKQE